MAHTRRGWGIEFVIRWALGDVVADFGSCTQVCRSRPKLCPESAGTVCKSRTPAHQEVKFDTETSDKLLQMDEDYFPQIPM